LPASKECSSEEVPHRKRATPSVPR
jgi:hypothetical protein